MDEDRTLYVRGIGEKISKEELTIYFQSRKQSGGGDISSIDVKEDEAVITFEEGDVAKRVGDRTHVINGTQVEVSLHPFMKDTQSQETSANQTGVVIIRGLSQNTTEDALLNYFENTRRSGGGDVEEVNVNGDWARIKFESVEVANRVVTHEKHSLNGAKLDVSFEMSDGDEEKSKTIKVAGLAAGTTEDSILNYFENHRRSGGGEVENVDLRKDTGVAFVTFKDANVTDSVLQRRSPHTLDGVTLSVTACNNTASLPDKEEAQESRTIEVTGLAAATTEDSITMFFENTRRSGGGDVEHVDLVPDQGKAVVTFVKAESARGVVNKGILTLDNAQLKITVKKPVKKPPTDTRRLVVKGLSDKTTYDGLHSYMEVVSGLEVLSIEFGQEGCALVTFSENYDFQTIAQKASKRKLESKQLSIQQVPVCNCVQLTGINRENTTKDAVLYYFDNPKNGGGVSNVELNIEEGWALVHFEDPQVLTKVLSKSHSLNGAQLDVKTYNPILGKLVPEADKHEVELTKIVPVDPKIMPFIFEQHNADYNELQKRHGVKIIWEERATNITVTTLDKASADRKKFDAACEEIASFLGAFCAATTQVQPKAWSAVMDFFSKNSSSVREKVNFQCLAEQRAIALTGKKADVEILITDIQELSTRVENKIKIEESKTTHDIEVPPIRLQFLKDLDFEKELESQHEDAQINILLDKGKVRIRAPQETVHKVSAAIWQAMFNIKESKVEMSQTASEVLRSRECQAFIKDRFTATNLQAALAFDGENNDNIVVMGMKANVAEKASELVKKLIIEECLDLDEDQVQLDRSEKWLQFKYNLTEKRILSLTFDRSNKQIRLVGIKEHVTPALKAVEHFLEDNTIVSKEVELPRGCKRFLAKYQVQEIHQIEDKLKEHFTRFKEMAADDNDLVVCGTPDGVNKGTKLIEDLASKVSSQKVFLNKPGMRKALVRSKGAKYLGLLENENKCVIEHFVPPKDAPSKKVEEEEEEASKKKESLCNFLTPEGKNILVYKDNICDRDVEVIVNAASSKLDHKGGVSKAIADAAGDVLKDECESYLIEKGSVLEGQIVVTSAGKLPFKKVIHAVGPRWRKEATREKEMGKSPREEKLLRYAVKSALDAAKTFKSIAIPAIGAGSYECPHALCAQIMVDSVLEFCQENPRCRLNEIQFTSVDDDVVKAFVKEMDSRFLEDPNYESSSDTKRKVKPRKAKEKGKKAPTPTSLPPSADIPNVIKTGEGLKLVLVIGDMSKEKVDVIVNTTSSNLDLTRNASAKALSDAAGPALQQECTAIGNVNTGDIVVTGGGKLCKHVFHTSCAGWNQQSGEQALRDVLKKCLNEAQRRKLGSIAIPAIGTGNLGYPRDRVAAASFDEVLAFSQKNPSSTLKEVHLVVYDKDLASVQAFQAELKNKKGIHPGTPPTPAAPSAPSVPGRGNKKRRGARGMAAKKSNPDDAIDDEDSSGKLIEELDPVKPEITIGSVTVQVETGDITKEVTDAIATLSNEELDVALGGGTGKAILSVGGTAIQDECSSLGRQSPGSIAVTGAGKLQVRKIYHMVPDFGVTPIKDGIFKCLQKADFHRLTSISFPAVGTGTIKKGVKEAAEAMLAAIFKFAQEQPTSLSFIRIVIYQSHMLPVFRSSMEACISSGESEPGIMSKMFGWLGFGKSGSAAPYVRPSKAILSEKGQSYLEIFAKTKQDIDKVVKEIKKYVADQCTQRAIERDTLSKLSKEQKEKIKNLEVSHDVVVTIEEAVGRISIRGDAEDVLDVTSTIYEILNQKIEEEHARGFEELVSKNTQWFYFDDDGSLEPYDTRINSQIEKAFGNGKNSVIVLFEGDRCEIVFKDMKETCLDDKVERRVVRKEIGKGIPLPIEWDAQPSDSSGKEQEVHLVPLNPASHPHEYKKVEDEIRKTANITIIKIERVQNPGLYRVYMVRKEQMEQKKGSNEKVLFHGTAESSCRSINKFGFNRSYCGKNATVYGNGVYFARDASYSTQSRYSPPDGAGNRYMYLARVLAGEYTTGRQGMITPPAKGSDATDTYDTVVDNPGGPGIYVVFYDNQCYPDYVITFK